MIGRGRYILVGKTPVPCDDLLTWGRWLETADRHVAKDTIGPAYISTVFLGLDHNFGSGPPLLFETMVFDGVDDSYQRRCSTWKQAKAMHAEAVAYVKAAIETADRRMVDARPPHP